jgi:hypothetical protein
MSTETSSTAWTAEAPEPKVFETFRTEIAGTDFKVVAGVPLVTMASMLPENQMLEHTTKDPATLRFLVLRADVSDMETAGSVGNWAISWWPLLAAIGGSLWWSVRAAQKRGRRAILGAVLAFALGAEFAPISFAAERHQQRKLSVALRRELPEAPVVTGSPVAIWIETLKNAKTTKPFHVTIDGVEVLARKQSNQAPASALRELLGTDPLPIPPGNLGGILGCTDQAVLTPGKQ